MEKVKWYEKEAGNVSGMRIIAMIAAIVGAVTTLCGVVSMFMGNPHCATAMISGTGLFSAGAISKAAQGYAENR